MGLKRLKVFFAMFMVAALAGLAGCNEKSDLLTKLPDDNTEDASKDYDAGGFFAPKVDILFVIDSSASMDSHQQNLSNNIDLFVNEMTSGSSLIDYRIAVTTTDDSKLGGTLSRMSAGGGAVLYVDKTTPNGPAILKKGLIVGTGGSGVEQMFNPVWRAFSPPLVDGANKGFLRQDAFLAVVFITDAEDQSGTNLPKMTADSLVVFLDILKGAGNWFGYGAIIPKGSSCNRNGESEPIQLQRFLNLTKSTYFSLCAPDFGKNLAALGSNLVSKVGRMVLLDRFPNPDTIRVTYGTQVIPSDRQTGWYYWPAQNVLSFGEDLKLSVQPKGTQIKIQFKTKHR